MSIFKKIFKKPEVTINSYGDFWRWFQANANAFYKVVKDAGNIEVDFFDYLAPRLNQLRPGLFFLSGMAGDNTAELIITADGDLSNIVFAEELIAAAPHIPGWKFTALKPELSIDNVHIKMGKHTFGRDNIHFYDNSDSEYPDEIAIAIVHDDMDEENRKDITNGVYIFLDNFLGELNLVTNIDDIDFVTKKDAAADLVPVEKLKDFLKWRQAEFVEKYEGVRHNTSDDEYATLEGETKEGNKLIAIVNTHLLGWEAKASHPWILEVSVKYNGDNNNGMPDKTTYELLNSLEDEMMIRLKDQDGHLNICRQTGSGLRTIYFASRDFRELSKVADIITKKYQNEFEIDYDIYKDKYWRSFNRFGI